MSSSVYTGFIHKADVYDSSYNMELYNLFSYLPDGFFKKYMEGTNIYYVFDTLAKELADLQDEITTVHDDLSIPDTENSILYNNYGTYVEYSKLSAYQDYDVYNHTYDLESYREGLRLLWESVMIGGTIAALRRSGQAVTGMAPLISEHYDNPRWELAVDSGTVSSVSGSLYFTDSVKTWIPNEWTHGFIQAKTEGFYWGELSNASDTWTNTSQNYPIVVNGCRLVCVGNKIFGIGGDDGANAHDDVYGISLGLDGSVGAWEAQESLPIAIAYAAVVYANNRLYVIGGRSSAGVPTTKVYFSNAISTSDGEITSWTETTNLPVALSGIGATFAERYIYLAGGISATGNAVTNCYRGYIGSNSVVSAWNTQDNLFEEIGNSNLIYYAPAHKFYVFGGETLVGTTGYSNRIETCALQEEGFGTWSRLYSPTLAVESGYIQLIAIDNLVYMIGRYNDSTSAFEGTVQRTSLLTTGAVNPIANLGSIGSPTGDINATTYNGFLFVLAHIGSDTLFERIDTNFLMDNYAFNKVYDTCAEGSYIYATDVGNNTVAKFRIVDSNNSIYHYVAKYEDSEALNSPWGITYALGYLYITDADDRVVKIQASDLSFISEYGTTGTGVDNLDSPAGIAYAQINSGTSSITIRVPYLDHGTLRYRTQTIYVNPLWDVLFIADAGNNRVVVRILGDTPANYVLNSTTPLTMSSPSYIAVSDDYVFVSDTGNARILVFDKSSMVVSGTNMDIDYVDSITGITAPNGVTVSNGYLYVSDSTDDCIIKYNATTFKEIYRFGSTGTGADEFDTPEGISVTQDGILLIADFNNDRVSMWHTSDTGLLPIRSNTYNSIATYDDINQLGIESGSTYVIGNSLLEDTTRVYADGMEYHEAAVHLWGDFDNAYGENIYSTMKTVANALKPAHTYLTYTPHNTYVIHSGDMLESGSYDESLMQIISGSLTPIFPTIISTYSEVVTYVDSGSYVPSGSAYYSDVIDLGSSYASYDWYVDYNMRIRNSSSGSVAVMLSDYYDDFSLSSWIVVQQDDCFESDEIKRYLKYRVDCYASGSEDFEFRGFSMRAMDNYLTASFTMSANAGIVPVTVTLTNTSTGFPTGYIWNFGDGEISTEENPTHSYSTVGIYPITLVASDGVQESSTTSYFNANVVVAGFTQSVPSGSVPLAVTFTDESTGDIDSYYWVFGDGDTSSTVGDVSHTYTVAGDYTPSLRVTKDSNSHIYTGSVIAT